jgi:uncharacterized protein YecE (DUF72 family)
VDATAGRLEDKRALLARARIQVGTSGWMYDSWRGPFYPPELAKKNWLNHYDSRFATSEINSSFYRTPSLEAVAGWRKQTGRDFVFAWKASKFITHWKRLNENCASSLDLLETRLKLLGPKLGPVLFQLPPNFSVNVERLESFLRMLSLRRKYAFEFRHPSWYCDEVFGVLKKRKVALCISDHHDAPSPWVVTAPHVYLRGHGPAGDYRDRYSARTLKQWAQRISVWSADNIEVFVYFDNDQKSAAPLDALRLIDMLAALLSAGD